MMHSKHLASTAALLTLLFTAEVQAADPGDTPESAVPQTAASNKVLAQQAVTSAAEDAIRSVLEETRLDLDIRLNGRRSAKSVKQAVDGR